MRHFASESGKSKGKFYTPRYARMVPFDEIADARNDFNLNLPRYGLGAPAA